MVKEALNLTIKKSKRKSISLQCLPNGKLLVCAPSRMSKREILDFVEKKRAWIERSRKILIEQRRQKDELTLMDGSLFPFLGRAFRVMRVGEGEAPVIVDYEEERILIHDEDDDGAKIALLAFIRKVAENYLPVRVGELAGHMGLGYKVIRIKDQKTRWGSCSSRGNLNLNARIMLASPEVIDYLIIHELSHLVQMNHSEAFYQIVERFCPEYRRQQAWLKEHGYLLHWGRN
jgi:hypothetical protein